MAQVVDPDSEVDPGGRDGGQPDPGAEGVAGYRVPVDRPFAIRVGGRVRFAVSDVLGWLAEQRETKPGRGPGGR